MTEEKRQKVMIVDDDKFLLDMYTMKFSESGFEPISAYGSVDAMNKLKDGVSPDLVLLDVVMPTMDGFEFLQKVKEENLAPDAKIVILSNLGQEEDIEKGKKLGAAGYIVKADATPSEVVKMAKDILANGSEESE